MSRQPRAWQGDARAWLRSKVGYHIRCRITEARFALRQHTTAEVNLLISLEVCSAGELPRTVRPAYDVRARDDRLLGRNDVDRHAAVGGPRQSRRHVSVQPLPLPDAGQAPVQRWNGHG